MTTLSRADPLPWVLGVLTVTTGLVDAVSVLGLGRVFTANMTGNVVFLGFAVVGIPNSPWPARWRPSSGSWSAMRHCNRTPKKFQEVLCFLLTAPKWGKKAPHAVLL